MTAVPTSAASGQPAMPPLQRQVIFLCALVAFLDGFDTQSIGPAAASIASTLAIPVGAFGAIFSASQIGFLIGAMSFSALGDRFGRKRILVVATTLFALASLGTALSETYDTLLAFRALAGLGLGGATPNFIGLASEYSPAAVRARVVTMLWAAVPFGGMIGGFASAASLPLFGWQAMFYLGCAGPLLLVPVLMAAMPESAEVRDHGDTAGKADLSPTLVRSPASAFTVAELFAAGRTASTVWLWLASFMTWAVLVVVALWTPALLKQAGFSPSAAASVLAFNNGGGIIGTVVMGVVVGKIHPHTALMIAFPAAAIFIAAIGWEATTQGMAGFSAVAVIAVFAGFFSSAAGGGIIGVSASTYPGEIRATGVGWAIGVGRMGSIVGPLVVGSLVAANWPVSHIYFAIALPALAAAGFIYLLARR
jgi:AAHS family 4-hydroxybenzoate transporter-like MFS transporter